MAAAAGGAGDHAGEPPAPGPVEFGGKTFKPLADGRYDAIILGTGLKECILSGLLSVKGKKVLHLDKNSYYGGDCASVNLTTLYQKFIKKEEPPKAFFDMLGSNRDYNVDLIPKFIMAGGNLVKILVQTDVTRYLDFKVIDGSYVYKAGGSGFFASAAGMHKVPATEAEAVKTGLVGMMQKMKLRSFLGYLAKYDPADPSTHAGNDLRAMTFQALADKFGLDKDCVEFLGHAMALQSTDDYLKAPAAGTVAALRLYAESLDRYGKSPYLYPVYGLGGLPESFSRLCAIHGGTFILNKPVDEVLFNADGTVAGVRSGSGDGAEVALAPLVIGEPGYFPPAMTRKTGRVIRTICLTDHPIAGLEVPDSAQIIIPKSQAGRNNDVYVSVVGAAHAVSAKGKYVAIVSTKVESAKPAEEVAVGISLLGTLITRFDNIVDSFEPVSDGTASRCFITSSYDASSHFEEMTEEVISLYARVMGEPLDLSKPVSLGTTD